MNIDQNIFSFPKSLPNDELGFLQIYPYKFPKVIELYETKIREIYDRPEKYLEWATVASDEVIAEASLLQEEYEHGDKNDLRFLTHIDLRFNKLFCFKFWIINYLIVEGPLADYYSNTLKVFAHKLTTKKETTEDYEEEYRRIERDLLQSDYADLYLAQALHGLEIVEFLKTDEQLGPKIREVFELLEEKSNKQKIEEIITTISETLLEDHVYKSLTTYTRGDTLYDPTQGVIQLPPLYIVARQVKMRKSPYPVTNFLVHAIEFYDENRLLKYRYDEMKQRISELKAHAKSILSAEEYKDFIVAYEMSRAFGVSKDIMGEADGIFVPTWEIGLHQQIYKLLTELNPEGVVEYEFTSFSAVFKTFVWHMPDDLKVLVMSQDNTYL